ncbi:MAG: amino acid ABC transporter substrate-binding protein [Solirubrobacterales bacterium]|nr:amino acid ABC transporter substrate-binding protein [Solirubrobacterales bacterium]MCB0859491.1 amino acid ABC transporter substrate-binding protein [Solirubrobacterales bacterium]
MRSSLRRVTGIVIGALAAVVLTFALTGCEISDSASGTFTPAHDNVLTVVTQPFPTVGFWEGTAAHPTGGFEYEMAEELASRLGLDGVKVETREFSEIVAGNLGDADIAMSLLTPTSEREENLDFTTPYLQTTPAFLTRDGTEIPDLETAQGMKIAVGRNTTLEGIVDDTIRPDQEPLRFENRDREIEAVRKGTADAALFDLAAAQAIIKESPNLTIAAQLNDPEPIAAALPKGSSNTDAVGSALRSMEADGTIDQLSADWLGISVSDLSANIPLLRTNQ